MSKPESEKEKGKFDVITKANTLAVYTIKICKNQKVFLPEYQNALTNDIIKTAIKIYVDCWTANNIRVGESAERWKKRRNLQESAALECNNLLAMIGLAKPLYHLASKRVKYWGQDTIDVRQGIRDWNAGDSKRYGYLEK